MNIAVTSLRSNGSSAVIDLLASFEGCSVAVKLDYEHYLYTMPGAFVDLEDKLLLANDPHRSDEAIYAFLDTMKRLYKYNFGWFGSYKRYLGEGFWAAVEEFVNEIASASGGGMWYGRYRRTRFSPITFILQLGAYYLKGAHGVRWGTRDVLDLRKPVYSSYVRKEDFCAAAKRFSEKFFALCRREGCEHMIYDHLLWPHNSERAEDFFGDDFRMVVLKRDARDVFIDQKYIANKVALNPEHVLPEEVNAYCDYIEAATRGAYPRNDDVVRIVQFEDLVYKTEETVSSLCGFLSLDKSRWNRERSLFDPAVSISNTQVFTGSPEWEVEAEVIARRLPQLCYDFPFRRDFDGEAARRFARERLITQKAVNNERELSS